MSHQTSIQAYGWADRQLKTTPIAVNLDSEWVTACLDETEWIVDDREEADMQSRIDGMIAEWVARVAIAGVRVWSNMQHDMLLEKVTAMTPDGRGHIDVTSGAVYEEPTSRHNLAVYQSKREKTRDSLIYLAVMREYRDDDDVPVIFHIVGGMHASSFWREATLLDAHEEHEKGFSFRKPVGVVQLNRFTPIPITAPSTWPPALSLWDSTVSPA
jgi:hypothetical protein